MFSNNMLSSLHSAALALTLTVALPAFAQSGTGLRTLETHGAAAGDWVPATSNMPGSMHGRMIDATGVPRFEIFAVTHVTVPAVLPGYDTGTMYGRLMSQRMQGDAEGLKKGVDTKPVIDPASIYVLGRWSVSQKTGAGRFSAVAFLEIEPLPLPIVLLDIVGGFEMRPLAEPAAFLAGPDTDPVASSDKYARPSYEKRLAYRAKVLANSGSAKLVAVPEADQGAALKSSGPRAVHFDGRWVMRD